MRRTVFEHQPIKSSSLAEPSAELAARLDRLADFYLAEGRHAAAEHLAFLAEAMRAEAPQ